MTLCLEPPHGCGRDKRVGGMTSLGWQCGDCEPAFSAAQQVGRGISSPWPGGRRGRA